jgi:GTP-binding protein Era
VRSGFATLVGRPNVGKSTLLNRILGQKVTIVSDKAQTTRTQVRGVMTRPDVQVVFVDTPGIHKPRTLLGERLNDTAAEAATGVDVVVFTVDATAPVGSGDRFVAGLVPKDSLCVVNKVDRASPEQVLAQLRRAGELGFAAYHPVSAVTGQGVDELVAAIVDRMPPGPLLYPDDMVTDVPEAFWVSELVREQLLHVTKDEVPHSVACRVTEWEVPERPNRSGEVGPRVRCEILVERDSQKGIVIGKGGAVLKAVGTAVREQLPPGSYLELFVKVDKDWQRRPAALDRLGY